MRYLIISDIHSNLAAFDAVLSDAGSFDRIWCLGDVVGYGPEPNECVERLKSLVHICVAGNHDWGSIGKLDIADFNAEAQRICQWTEQQLSPENRSYLATRRPSFIEKTIPAISWFPHRILSGISERNG